MDKYQNYAELNATETEGQDFSVDVNDVISSQVAVIAPHGGSIEPGTSELCRAIAADRYSYALFEGIKSSANQDLHITSSRFDEPRFCQLVSTHTKVIALHGEKSHGSVVYLGGKDVDLAKHISQNLSQAGFKVAIHDNPQLQGKSTNNICNRGLSAQGVQLEIAAGLRRQMFSSLNRQGRQTTTRVFEKFVKALQRAIESFSNH